LEYLIIVAIDFNNQTRLKCNSSIDEKYFVSKRENSVIEVVVD